MYQPWDPLKVCVVGKSYSPLFYEFIKNSKLRDLFQKIAEETEEDFENLTRLLESFNVKVLRPLCPQTQVDHYLTSKKRIPGPLSMNPRDQMIMIGDKFFFYPYMNIAMKSSGRNIVPGDWNQKIYDDIKGPDWPIFTDYENLPDWIKIEIEEVHHLKIKNPNGEDLDELAEVSSRFPWWANIIDHVRLQGNDIIDNQGDSRLNEIPANGITRCGKDLFFGVGSKSNVSQDILNDLSAQYFPNYRCNYIRTDGHIDGCFTPVKPGLIVSIHDITEYKKTFPGWEVVYLPGESWSKVKPFLDLKEKNQGRWWIKGHEYDNDLIEFVETWLTDWVGYVEESVFDVNILVIDQNNIVVNGYNKQAFDAFKRHGITAHICPMRHRYFWDGGVHCVTLDLHREGYRQDFFPFRN